MRVRCLLTFVVVLFVAGLLTTSGYAVIDPETCVGLWLLDEGSGEVAEDSSGSQNNGTLMKGPNWVAGKFGSALSFDGTDDYVDCGNSASLNITSTITVVALVKLNSLAGKQTIISKAQSGGWGIEYNVSTPQYANKFSWAPHIAGSYRVVGADDNPQIGTWYHLVGVYDGSTVKFYIDGTPQTNTLSVTGAITISTPQVEIGSNPPGVSNIFNGVIDEAAVFNVPLNEQDVKTLMNKGLKELLGQTAAVLSSELATTWAAIKAR